MSEIHPEVAKIFDFVIVSDAALQYCEKMASSPISKGDIIEMLI